MKKIIIFALSVILFASCSIERHCFGILTYYDNGEKKELNAEGIGTYFNGELYFKTNQFYIPDKNAYIYLSPSVQYEFIYKVK